MKYWCVCRMEMDWEPGYKYFIKCPACNRRLQPHTTILALDMATNTGWAIRDQDGKIHSGYKNLGSGSHGSRFANLRDLVGELIKEYLPDFVVYEQAHHRGGASTRIGVGLNSVLLERVSRTDAGVFAIHTLTLKRLTTGSGKADKPEMRKAAMKHFPQMRKHIKNKASEDEVDALCVLYAWQNFRVVRLS